MKTLNRALATLLTVVLVTPSAFFVASPRVSAQVDPTDVSMGGGEATGFLSQLMSLLGLAAAPAGVPTFNPPQGISSVIGAIRNTLTSIHAATSAAAQVAQMIDQLILQPLAFVLSGRLMQFLTSSVLAFVVGKANGTGIPQFIVDVEKSFQTVADSQALAYLNQLGRHSNSPFASSIRSTLYNDYAAKTSLAGFWAANLNTLRRSSPNVPGFLSGRWQDGGIKAWFALTTQIENNPYTDYETKRDKLASVIGAGPGGAAGAHAKKADWGKGFLSWCGSSNSPSTTPGPSSISEGANIDRISANVDRYRTYADAAEGQTGVVDSAPTYYAPQGVNPGAPCVNPDGTEGTIRTPGSVIGDTLNRVLGSEQSRIERMGNVGPMINSILNNIATVVRTANFAATLLGGSSGGLLGVDGGTAANSTGRLIQYQAAPPLGTSNATAVQTGAAALPASVTDMSSRVAQYEAAWNTIGAAANTAASALTSLGGSCASQASAAQTGQVNPVLAQAAQAAADVATVRATIQRARNELASGSPSYATTIQTLQTMKPTLNDLVQAQQDAAVTNGATANPVGSLTVSGGSIVDRMTLITQNAQAIQSSCTIP